MEATKFNFVQNTTPDVGQNGPAAGMSQPPPLENYGSTLAEQLENITAAITLVPNTRDYGNPVMNFLSPGFTDIRDGVVCGRSLEESIKYWFQARHNPHPNYRQSTVQVNASVDEEAGRATVWIVSLIRGFPDGLEKQSVTQFHWVKRQQQWRAQKMVVLRTWPQTT